MLPFMIPRLFRPLMLEGWGLTNSNFGDAFAAYGVCAMISYLIGGPLADRYHPRILIAASLALTALGGFYLMKFPSATSLMITYGFFGVSTILLMWGALIKTTHIAGGEKQRSLAMGVLDGGRGLAAAAFSSLLVFAVALAAPDLRAPQHQLRALEVIYILTIALSVALAAGILVSLADFQTEAGERQRWNLKKATRSLKERNVWLLSLVILGSYCGYKGIDNYSIYLVDVFHVDLAKSSLLTTVVFWLRPAAAFGTGFLADKLQRRVRSGRFLLLFILLSLGGLSQLLLAYSALAGLSFAFAVITLSAAFAYGLRAVYFSVFGDLKTPPYLVGTITGIVSFIGFTPDVFFSWVTGRLIDAYPGAVGYQFTFAFTAMCLFFGAAASLMLYRSR